MNGRPRVCLAPRRLPSAWLKRRRNRKATGSPPYRNPPLPRATHPAHPLHRGCSAIDAPLPPLSDEKGVAVTSTLMCEAKPLIVPSSTLAYRLPPSPFSSTLLLFDSSVYRRYANPGRLPTRGRPQGRHIALCSDSVPGASVFRLPMRTAHLRPISPSYSFLYYTSSVHHHFRPPTLSESL